MDYKELTARLNNAAGGPDGVAMCYDAATAIDDLLSRAEKAEAKCKRLDESRERANESAHMWESRCKMLEARAEAAERERDSLREVLDMYGGEEGIVALLKQAKARAESAEARESLYEGIADKYQKEIVPRLKERLEKAEQCIAEIEDALKFGRESAAMLMIYEWRG